MTTTDLQTEESINQEEIAKMQAQASSIKEFLSDTGVEDKSASLIVDFVLDNYVPKKDAQKLVEDTFKLALERILMTLKTTCYRTTGTSDLGTTLEAGLRDSLRDDL